MRDPYDGGACRRRDGAGDHGRPQRRRDQQGGVMNFLEDLEIGQARAFGSFTFTAESIKAFAREFDPQPFHLDEDAAKRSALFGGLAASGWHVASVSMGLRIRDAQR